MRNPTARGWALAVPLVCALGAVCGPALTAGSGGPVSAFPSPGSAVVSPQAQIAFRGSSKLSKIQVVGSQSGDHDGNVLAHSDGDGMSFVPARSFAPGETVTVKTDLNIQGGSSGNFQFTVASPTGPLPIVHWHVVPRVRGGVWRFRSRPDLAPAAVKLSRRGKTAMGDIFLGEQGGPLQQGPEVLDGHGDLLWFKRMPGIDSAMDVKVQTYLGRQVMTWWQGNEGAGVGQGRDVIYNNSYEQIATVNAANGLRADLHEFVITPRNTALVTAFYPVYVDARSVGGAQNQIVLDSVVQEIDIPTGLLLFQWDSLDHVPLSASYQHLPPRHTRQPYDYFHVNSVDVDGDGTLVISGRNTWAAYKVDRSTGQVIWSLGGKHSSFGIRRGAGFAFQHDVRVSDGDRTVTMIDNGAGDYAVHKQSRALRLQLDFKHRTARRVLDYFHKPPLVSIAKGDYQRLREGGAFIGWGATQYFSEYNRHGQLVLDGRFVGLNASYRAYRQRWRGTPKSNPDVAATSRRGHTTVFASWNGATGVAFWRVRNARRQSLATVPRRDFETAIRVVPSAYVQVQALDARHRVLASSALIRA